MDPPKTWYYEYGVNKTMKYGIFAGMSWAMETIILSIALSLSPFISDAQAIFLAPFVATSLHDFTSFLWAILYNFCKGQLNKVLHVLLHTKSSRYVILAAFIGGPIGMSGYCMAIQYMGASMGAVASAIFPAIGSILAWIFLKERISIQRWVFLCFTLLGVFGLSYSSDIEIHNLFMGILGVTMCSLGWGSEAVILAKSLQDEQVKDEYILPIRQASSALFYVCILLPLLKGFNLFSVVVSDSSVWFWIGLASLFATLSYLFYYRAISTIGAAKAMALNVSYSAWALIFSVVLFQEYYLLNPVTIICTVMVLVCSILATTDFKNLI